MGPDPLWNDVWLDAEPVPEPFVLGPWAGEVRRGGSLSDLTFGGVSVLRAVRGVLRDRDWRTAPGTLTSTERTDGGLRLAGEFLDDGGVDLLHADWTLTVEATGDTFAVEFTATARTAFQRNRFGLVVLQRPDEAGTPFEVTHPDGRTTTSRFSEDISPHQPARDIAALAWSRPGVDVHVEFAGDVFEMEDQRNWTDASWKTYSTPLDEPFPVDLPVGAQVRQRVVVRCSATRARPVEDAASATVELLPAAHPVPQWGTTAPVVGVDGPLLVELVLPDPAWPVVLEAARAGGRPLDVRLVTDDPAALAPALAALEGVDLLRLGVHSLTTHVSTAPLWGALTAANPALQPGGELVAGARSHFTELNRTAAELPPDADAVVFASTPQMHDVGRDQVLEALQVQGATAAQAVRIAGGRAVHVGPITLRPRFNAVATTPWRPDRDRVPRDPRVDSRGFAAWVVASAAAFAVPGVATVTFGDLDGPAADSLRLLAPLAGLERLVPAEALPEGLHLLAGRTSEGTHELVRVVVANVGATTRTVHVGGRAVTLAPGEVTAEEVGSRGVPEPVS